ncbi:MAG: ATP-binding protein, partial [Candidatus Cloacimonadota bacterium]|nr:ATP-binding protein [Candidatus Cloacimonadota bacterium]
VIAKHIEEQRSISYKKQLKDKVKQRTSLLVDEISNRVTLEDKLKNIFDTSLDAIVTIDHNGIIDIFNISAEKMFKYSKEEVIGKSIQTLIPQKGKIKSIKNLISLIVMNKQKNIDTGAFVVPAKKSDGIMFDAEISASVSYEGDNPVLMIMLRDLSEQRRIEDYSKDLEVQLVTNSKLAEIGKIAALISKEIKTPLLSIQDTFKSILQNKTKGEFSDEFIERIKLEEKEILRVLTLNDHLITVDSKSNMAYKELDLTKIINSVETLLNEQIVMHSIVFKKEIDSSIPVTEGFADQIQYALLSLLQNSIDATEKNSSSKIKIKIFGSRDKSHLIIKVKDNGKGITEENMHKVFDPFFSTKSASDVGLSLTISYGIIQSHGGTIYCNSRIDKGTTFTIELPLKK